MEFVSLVCPFWAPPKEDRCPGVLTSGSRAADPPSSTWGINYFGLAGRRRLLQGDPAHPLFSLSLEALLRHTIKTHLVWTLFSRRFALLWLWLGVVTLCHFVYQTPSDSCHVVRLAFLGCWSFFFSRGVTLQETHLRAFSFFFYFSYARGLRFDVAFIEKSCSLGDKCRNIL